MEITFPGGLAIEAHFDGLTLRTDQPEAGGGEGSAPSPFDTFLASIGTCSGFFALRFCQQRKLSTDGLKITLDTAKGSGARKLDRITLTIHLPEGFPDKYRDAIVKATDMCAVKKVIQNPPDFETVVV
ncbi:MAG: osmotically inducible protein OsmC [Desulfuromonas sp.]|uniref:OsmC family protein n=1 Tax=Desulfuromonas sp. TaxID=892 RepID=UPI000CACA577|nr:OsmC family protein [Desulfuromonas sp.]PLX86638.1 MAG: osmotically inducible protein OsmC [Desulfuromonas sp.]